MVRKPRPFVLILLDGWGLSSARKGNAIRIAGTPNMDRYTKKFPSAALETSGESVGLPAGQMGNSEVGHLNIGAGRIIYQELTRINKAIADGSFNANPVLLEAMATACSHGSRLHLLGLLSDGGVHSHIQHLYALLSLAAAQGVKKVFLHAFLDGRDVPPANAGEYITALEKKLAETKGAELATIAGRYYSMDRDKRWERTEKAYRALAMGTGEKAAGGLEALEKAYRRGETDEFVLPTVITDNGGRPLGKVEKDDVLIFYNFRPDRARQLTRAFTDSEFSYFDRGETPPLPFFFCLTQYDKTIAAPVAFPPQTPANTLGEVLSKEGLRQLRLAETEKYAHVTFFFNGGIEKPYPGEERILVPSPKVATYDLQPEMSAPGVTEVLLNNLAQNIYDVIIVNYANPDMVGHTGVLPAVVKAVETVDSCLGQLVDKILAQGGMVFITADHGNAENMIDETRGGPHTAHTSNKVPLIAAGLDRPLRQEGILADLSPTILEVLGISIPREMTGSSLLKL